MERWDCVHFVLICWILWLWVSIGWILIWWILGFIHVLICIYICICIWIWICVHHGCSCRNWCFILRCYRSGSDLCHKFLLKFLQLFHKPLIRFSNNSLSLYKSNSIIDTPFPISHNISNNNSNTPGHTRITMYKYISSMSTFMYPF